MNQIDNNYQTTGYNQIFFFNLRMSKEIRKFHHQFEINPIPNGYSKARQFCHRHMKVRENTYAFPWCPAFFCLTLWNKQQVKGSHEDEKLSESKITLVALLPGSRVKEPPDEQSIGHPQPLFSHEPAIMLRSRITIILQKREEDKLNQPRIKVTYTND